MKKLIYCAVATVLASVASGCGDNPVSIGVVVSTLDFGSTDCGTTAIPRVLVVTNPTADNFNFTITLDKGASSSYIVIPPIGSVLARSQATVMVYAKPIPAISAVTDNLYGETLTVTTDMPNDMPHSVAITQTAHGAILKMSSDMVSFATAQPLGAAPATQPLTITNSGNADVSVTVASSGFAFDYNPGTDQTIAAGGTLSGNVEYNASATSNERNTLSITATGPVCQPLPTAVATGTGTLKGLAAHALPAGDRGRPNQDGGAPTLCVRTTTGVVACTGRNSYGMRGATDDYLQQLTSTFGGGGPPPGFGEFGTFNLVQTETGILRDVVELAAGRGFYCARRSEKDVWCWGAFEGTNNNHSNMLTNHPFASQIISSGVLDLAAGYSNICTVRAPLSNLVCSSRDTGRGGNYSRFEWKTAGATAAAVSGATGYGLLNDGTLVSYGMNRVGERGNTDPNTNTPASAVEVLTNVTQVVAGGGTSPGRSGNGGRFGCAVEMDQSLWCWGGNRHGQLANGTSGDRNTVTTTPAQVLVPGEEPVPIAGVTDVAAGQSHACAITGASVWCWGRGREGEIGSGNLGDVVSLAEETVPALTNAVKLGLGQRASCVVLSTGGIRCWGELGGSRQPGPTPIDAFEP